MVAKKIGLSADAIRFYERNALVPRAPRSQGGFRQYDENDIETLVFIRRVQGLGFTQRNSRSAETARESPTALCSRAAPSGREAGRGAEETCRPEPPGGRVA